MYILSLFLDINLWYIRGMKNENPYQSFLNTKNVFFKE